MTKRLALLVVALALLTGTATQAAMGLVLSGTDSQDVAPFRLAKDSVLTWSAPEGADSNFIISTRQDIPVNALGPTSGKSFLEKGRYTDVSIIATGPWTITITPAPPRPQRKTFVFSGVDGMNLPSFVLKKGAKVKWSAPDGADSNFILSTDQDIVVNALGPVKGKSYMSAGLYTGVGVTATGPWTIRIG